MGPSRATGRADLVGVAFRVPRETRDLLNVALAERRETLVQAGERWIRGYVAGKDALSEELARALDAARERRDAPDATPGEVVALISPALARELDAAVELVTSATTDGQWPAEAGLSDEIADQEDGPVSQDYTAAVTACAVAAQLLAGCDLPKMLRAIDRAGVVGPLVNPTLYRDREGAMRQDAELMRAALPLRRVGAKLIAADQGGES